MIKIEGIDKTLHEIKNEILGCYNSELEMFGRLNVGDQVRQTLFRLRNIAGYES